MLKKQLVVFGSGDMAQLAQYYFNADSQYAIAAFTLDAAFIKDATFGGLPVVPFEEITKHFSPKKYHMFIALGYSKVNALRKEKYLAAKGMGYNLASYVSSRASVLNAGRFGDNCFIFEDNTIQPFVTVGSNVTMWSGNHIGHHSTIGDHCFITSHAVISGGVQIGEQCFIGVNATLRDHIKVGARCVVGAGALLLADTEPEGVYIGTATERAGIQSVQLKKI